MGGVTEVAETLGVSRQRLAVLRARSDFPDPVGEISHGPIWDLDEIAAWKGSRLRSSTSGRPKAELAARTLDGRFVLESPHIGSGGFADVYRAVDRKTAGTPGDRPVAVKVLRDVDAVAPEAIRRFQRELRLLEDLEHPNVIPVIAHGDMHDDDGIWYAMPLAQGSLLDLLPEMVNNNGLILDLIRQVCAGLTYMHDAGIYHRDLKPANILRTNDGAWAISDFGLAVEVERKTTILTSTLRSGLGSFCYSAPEQLIATRTADHRSDIFSLGKVLQHLLTGELPITNETPAGPLRPIVERATSQHPDHRYQKAADFLEAIEHALGATETRWETPEDVAKRLLEVVRLPKPTMEDLGELISWAEKLDEDIQEEDMSALSRVLPWISPWSVRKLWTKDSEAFRRIYDRYAAYVGSGGFEWDYCDVLADFGRRVVEQTDDPGILRSTARSLAALGASHNRWYVRNVLIAILQPIRDGEAAVAATEGLRAAGQNAVEWTFNDFSLRSLHPSLRTGIASFLDQKEAG